MAAFTMAYSLPHKANADVEFRYQGGALGYGGRILFTRNESPPGSGSIADIHPESYIQTPSGTFSFDPATAVLVQALVWNRTNLSSMFVRWTRPASIGPRTYSLTAYQNGGGSTGVSMDFEDGIHNGVHEFDFTGAWNPLPVIESISAAGGNVTVAFTCPQGDSCVLQSTATLSPAGVWQNV